MAQFHIDFDSDGSSGSKFSIESYVLAKKVYTDKSESVGNNDDVITGDHIRFKNVPTSCIEHTANSMSLNPMYVYKHLFGTGNQIKFDLTENGMNCGFKYERGMSVRSYEENEFTREDKFNSEFERIEIS